MINETLKLRNGVVTQQSFCAPWRTLPVVVFCFFVAFPAAAGSLSCTATNDAGAVLGTASFPITTANLGRVAAMLKVRYGQVPSGPADPITGIIPMRDRTNAEAIQASIGGFVQGLKDAVKQDEGAAAADTAVKAVAAIP